MNPRIREIAPSLIRAINARKRPDDIDLGLGEPTLAPDLAAFAAALEWTREHGSPYSPNAGFPELREAIATHIATSRWAGGAPGAENVCVTVGSEEAIYLAIRTVVDPAADEVLIVEPCYLAYPKICVLEGIRHRMVALSPDDGFAPRADAVLNALGDRTRLIVLNSPSNPTGRIWPARELERLAAALAAERPDVYLLSDEVYRELYYTPDAPPSPAAHHPLTLVAGSLSKSNALTGLRLGWLAGPKEVIREAVKVHQFVNTAASTFGQRVALELFARPGSLQAHRSWYLRARERLLSVTGELELDVVPPDGAFYALVRVPERLDGSLRAAERLLEDCRVVTVPGVAFGASGEGWLRLSWVAPPERVEEGLRRIARWFVERG